MQPDFLAVSARVYFIDIYHQMVTLLKGLEGSQSNIYRQLNNTHNLYGGRKKKGKPSISINYLTL